MASLAGLSWQRRGTALPLFEGLPPVRRSSSRGAGNEPWHVMFPLPTFTATPEENDVRPNCAA